MEPYHIKHQHPETANYLEHNFANRYWLHTRYKHLTPIQRNQGFPMDTHLKLELLKKTDSNTPLT